ncbi:MAG: 50S ribosomal protein L16 [Candidatus Micrarchaeota archaeon]|nr:50S ribosomal protein L16 [Candidatus Micrarchaeota archaeon]
MGRRPARTVRDMDKVAYTRFSRNKPRKSYIKAMPHRHLHIFDMGKKDGNFNTKFDIVAEKDVIIRDCAVEAARVAINKVLEKALPEKYFFKVLKYPFHVIRENKMIAGAGADRLSKGMRRSFGRTTDVAVRIQKGSSIFMINSDYENVEVIKRAAKLGINKLGGMFRIKVEKYAEQKALEAN